MLGGPQSPVAWDLQGRSGLLDEGAMGILPIPERRVAFAAARLGLGWTPSMDTTRQEKNIWELSF